MIDRQKARELFERFGPVDDWLIPASDIEAITLTVDCPHERRLGMSCSGCLVPALVRRQMAILAERLGCTPEDAARVGERLVREYQEAGE